MITDLSSGQDLHRIWNGSGLDQTEIGRWIMCHPWRQLMLVDLPSAVDPKAFSRQIALEHFGRGEMELLAEQAWNLEQIELTQWTPLAAQTLARGLAYSGLEQFPASTEDRIALRIMSDLVATFQAPECSSTWHDLRSTFSPVSSHTFDEVALVHDRKRAALLLVVDED